jgi:NAD(P)-dependent dehydrogenase (short-subunit alcohol dehydrogenase family)
VLSLIPEQQCRTGRDRDTDEREAPTRRRSTRGGEENIPLTHLGTPQDVANAVLFLASSEADYITGTTVYVDGGLLWNYAER